jgi:hypothetical protein
MTKKTTPPQRTNRKVNESTASAADNVSDPLDARECLRNGVTGPVGRFLRDEVAPLLRSLSAAGQRSTASDDLPPPDPDWPFEFGAADMQWAINRGRSELVAQYPIEIAKVLSTLGDMLDPEGTSEYVLRPTRRRRGKPKDASFSNREAQIIHELESSRARHGGKLEAALAEVGAKRKLSRATLMRIRGRAKQTRRC